MKIFSMNEYDWWMDTDLESAKKNYMEHIGFVGEIDDELFFKPHELTDLELDSLKFIPDEDNGPACTFREQANRMEQVPQFFASTEY